jgi:hypothetical protein
MSKNIKHITTTFDQFNNLMHTIRKTGRINMFSSTPTVLDNTDLPRRAVDRLVPAWVMGEISSSNEYVDLIRSTGSYAFSVEIARAVK